MDPLVEKLNKVVTTELDGETSGLEVFPGGRIAGHVISPRFDGLEFEDRRALLRQVLESNFSRDELPRLSLLLTYSPQEWHLTLS